MEKIDLSRNHYGSIGESDRYTPQHKAESSLKKWGRLLIFSAIAINGVIVTIFLFSNNIISNQQLSMTSFETVSNLQFSSSNEYGDTKEGKFAYPFLGSVVEIIRKYKLNCNGIVIGLLFR